MITLTVTKARNIKQKMLGLIGKKQAYPFLMETHFGIHTFGVMFPIDVIILDDEYKVVNYFESMKPLRVWFWNPKHKLVVELPNGTIEEKKIKKGEKIKLVVK